MRQAFAGIVMLFVLAFSPVAQAQDLVTDAAGKVIGINGLGVDGTTYDAMFIEGSYNDVFAATNMVPTFLNDETGAEAAANAITNFFNNRVPAVTAADLAFVIAAGATNSSDSDLVVPWRQDATSIEAYSADWLQSSTSGPWQPQDQSWDRDFDNDLVAMVKFVPEPSSYALGILGLWSLCTMGRQRTHR